MYSVKDKEFSDLQKCGEIMLAAKTNKVLMVCHFCQQLFTHLHGFVRHLQLHHGNKLDLIKQDKEVVVYTVEELMSGKAGTSCVENEELISDGEDVQMARKEKHGSHVGDYNEGSPNLNTSIIEALRDFDVSFSLLDNCINETRNDVDNTLLREFKNDTANNGSILCDIDCTNSPIYLEEANDTPAEALINKSSIEKNVNATKEQNKILRSSSNFDKNKNIKVEQLIKNSKINQVSREEVFQLEVKKLEDALHNEFSNSTNKKRPVKYLNEKYKNTKFFTKTLQKNNTKSEKDIFPNEQFSKDYADVMGKIDLSLLNKQSTTESEKSRKSKNNCQEKTSKENVKDQNLYVIKERDTLDATTRLEKAQQKSASSNKNTVISKYCKSRLNDGKIQDERNTSLSKFTKSIVLREVNSYSTKPMNSLQKHIKRSQMSTINKSLNRPKNNLNLNCNNSVRKEAVLQRMHHIKKQIFKSVEENDRKCHVNGKKKNKKPEILIENIQILPNLEEKTLKPLLGNSFEKSCQQVSISVPIESHSHTNMSNQNCLPRDLPTNNDKSLITTSLKRPASSLSLNGNKLIKLHHSSPAKNQNANDQKSSELKAIQFDFSENAVDFLQSDFKENCVNVESIYNEDFPTDNWTPNEISDESREAIRREDNTIDESSNCGNLINSLIEKRYNKETSAENSIKKNANARVEQLSQLNTFEDFDKSKDIMLLAKFGLKIIKLPDFEDYITSEERDKIIEKANKFANIYKNWPPIWSTKNSSSVTFKEELNRSFNQLLTQVNKSFNLDLSIVELKRLTNLINKWYTQNFNSQLIKKRKIPDSTKRYLFMFHYIPKIVTRYYFCEFCDEYFNSEHKYVTHRMIHTVALYPYTCPKCLIDFNNVKSLKNHEASCNSNIKTNNCKIKPPLKTYENVKSRNKCLLCEKVFPTAALLYEHSKTHLKFIYNCTKCKLVFASAIDVQNHMNVCNINKQTYSKSEFILKKQI